MADHDSFCPALMPPDDCGWCLSLRMARADQDKRARADERERIAQRQEKWAQELLTNDRHSWPVTAKLLATDLPQIARNGGWDG